ncbi:UNVERIFIED_CONTAM: 16S rRNA pseudouridine516 synthase [Acetivibrio alkalicellulosi]
MRDTQRIDKLLSNSGFGTRKEIKQLIKNGALKVNGNIVKDSGMHVDPERSMIEVAGEIFKYRKYIYLMMNKPQGVISSTDDKKHATVVDILPDCYKCFNLFPVGRLDIDTVGLLIMTNDGQLAHELLSPKKHVPKKYYAVVSGNINEEHIGLFKKGVILDDGYNTLPSELKIIKTGDISEVEVIIHEGKFHQIKRMFEAIDKKVKYLKRIKMGNLILDDTLSEGECRELSDEEIVLLRDRTI